jgi:hypothetical protein
MAGAVGEGWLAAGGCLKWGLGWDRPLFGFDFDRGL